MQSIHHSGVPLLGFEQFNKFHEIIHFVTSRHGGISSGVYTSLNLGFGTADGGLSVLTNRHKVADSLAIPLDYFVMANQVHGTHVEVVTREKRGAGAFHRHNALPATDAMVTNEPEICLFVMAADCVPVLFFDPVKKVIGAAHAGWRGTIGRIAAATVLKMQEIYQCHPQNICAAIGPSIGPCCYEVGGEVIDAVLQAFGTTEGLIRFDNDESLPIFNLWQANKLQLMETGLKEENIETAGICTKCRADDFFSSRQGKGITGRFGAGIMIRRNFVENVN
jgi:polyphenol oxidase